jgi:hypothetical protein
MQLEMIATKTLDDASHPLQDHRWRFDIPAGDLATDHRDLIPTRLDTGTDLGSYGAIDVSLDKGTKLASRSVTCPETGAVLARVHSRTGTFSGSFDFKPGAGLPTHVAPTSFSGTISKTYQTDRTCTRGGGGGGCPVGKSLLAFSSGGGRGYLDAGKTLEHAFVSFSSGDYDMATGVTTLHAMLAVVPATAVAISPNTAVVHSKPFGPWASGTVSFTLKEAHVAKLSKTCTRTRYDATSENGTIVAHFATGDFDYTTPFQSGVSVTITKRI